MKHFLSVLSAIIFLPLITIAAPPYTSDFRSNVELSSADIAIFDLVERALRVRQEVYAQKLAVSFDETDRGDACRIADRKEATAVVEFRNTLGVLSTVAYTVCVGETPPDSFILKPVKDSEKIIAEAGFKADTWTIKKDDKGVNDDGGVCGVSKTVTQQVCAPNPYKIYAWEINPNVIRSSKSELEKVEIDPTNQNCVNVSFHLEGRGQNRVMLGLPPQSAEIKTDCSEGAWFKYVISLRGYLTGFKN